MDEIKTSADWVDNWLRGETATQLFDKKTFNIARGELIELMNQHALHIRKQVLEYYKDKNQVNFEMLMDRMDGKA